MTLRLVGAGLGRTGTSSLRIALEQLLGGRCYHMSQVMARPNDVKTWRDLADTGAQPDWRGMFADFDATLDWPAAAYWEPIAAAHPDALVLLSERTNADEWYASFSKTIVPVLLDESRYAHPALQMSRAVTFGTFTRQVNNPEASKHAYDAHNAHVRATVPAQRLVQWRPGDGWGPLCAALEVPEPAEEFPHANTSDDFRDLLGLDRDEPVRELAQRSTLDRVRRRTRLLFARGR